VTGWLGIIMAETPLATVAMPVFNAGRFLRPAVLSIIRQTLTDWELLIIDDGSTDGAVDSIADIDEPRIIIVRDGENKGLAARLNEAADRARGKYFARMDQDGRFLPGATAASSGDAGVRPGNRFVCGLLRDDQYERRTDRDLASRASPRGRSVPSPGWGSTCRTRHGWGASSGSGAIAMPAPDPTSARIRNLFCAPSA
jgi:glycosyltransferase involved in cell wall biosynthesis